MLYPLRALQFLAFGLGAYASLGSVSNADILYTMTTTGTITSGNDTGTFGVNGSLAGYTYTARQTFDATLSTLTESTGRQNLSNAYFSTSVTVNNQTFFFSGNGPVSELDLRDTVQAGIVAYYNSDVIYGESRDTNLDAFLTSFVSSYDTEFMNSASLSQIFNYLVAPNFYAINGSSGTDTEFATSQGGGAGFQGYVSSVSLNVDPPVSPGGADNGGAPVPEPISLALFASGLTALGALRRLKRA